MSCQSLGRLGKQREEKGLCSRTQASRPVLLQPTQSGREAVGQEGLEPSPGCVPAVPSWTYFS